MSRACRSFEVCADTTPLTLVKAFLQLSLKRTRGNTTCGMGWREMGLWRADAPSGMYAEVFVQVFLLPCASFVSR